jgi:hypothetical protein
MKYIYYLGLTFFLLFSFQSAQSQNCPLACNNSVIVALNPNCSALVTPDMILEAPGSGCAYSVTIFDANGQPIGDMVNGSHIGQTLEVRVFLNGNSCWGTITVIDGQAPIVDCQQNVTASCAELDPDDVPTFLVDDNCDPDPEIEILADDIMSQSCSGPYSAIRTITYRAVDASGNESDVCTQTIQYEREELSDVDFPANRDGLTLPAFQCSDPSWDLNGNNYPDPAEAGVPTIDGVDLYTEEVCDFWVYFSDAEIPLCGGGFKVLRTWSVMDNCSSDIIEQIQVIKVEDSSTPTIHCPSDITVAGGYDCGALVELPEPVIGSGCSGTANYTVSVNGGVVSESNGRFIVSGLDVGTYIVTYTVENPCGGAPTSCEISLTVTSGGGNGPIAICDQNTVVALGSNGTAKVFASTFNDGSYSDCGDVLDIKVRRMVEGQCPPGVDDDTEFRDYVEFCCADVANNPITVVFRVFDSNGNTNECMVFVTVQNKLNPTIHCPPDISIDCDYPLNVNDLSDFGTVVTDPNDRNPIYVYNGNYPNGFVGYDGLATANCGTLHITERVDDFTNCGGGYIKRTFTATDQGGASASCVQKIYVNKDKPFNCNQIEWPDDVEINSCSSVMTDPDQTGRPEFNSIGCGNIIATNYSDETFSVVDGFCYKILRTWKVLDWCGSGGTHKICEHTQVIKVRDQDAPEFTSGCDDVTICTDITQGCEGFVSLKPTIEDCTPESDLKYEYFIDINDNNPGGRYDIIGTTSSIDRYFSFGTHRVLWRVTDGCGNIETCSYHVTVEDCKQPTPVCIHGISTVVMPVNGMIEVEATVFDRGSFDNCTPESDLVFSFSPDVNQTTRIFTCEDEGINEVEIWVTDGAGNQEYCITELSIQDNRGTCPDTGSIVSGSLTTSGNFSIPSAQVDLDHSSMPQGMSSTSDYEGAFNFEMFDPPFMTDIEVRPTSDEQPYLGLTAYDLYLMQRHILNLKPFDQSAQYIAADVNRDGQVNAFDMIALRELLLRNTNEFPNNHSWRFRDARFEPEIEDDPFAITESITLNSPSKLADDCDFIGIKIGDVDLSARPGIDLRAEETKFIYAKNQHWEAGELVSFQLSSQEEAEWVAYEMSWAEPAGIQNVDIAGVSKTAMGDKRAVAQGQSSATRDDWFMELQMETSNRMSLEQWVDQAQMTIIAFDEEGTPYELKIVVEPMPRFSSQVYPNPFLDYLQLEWSDAEVAPAQIELVNVEGKLIQTYLWDGTAGDGQLKWQLNSSISKGVYLLLVRDAEGQIIDRHTITGM